MPVLEYEGICSNAAQLTGQTSSRAHIMYGNDALGKRAPREKQRMTIDELYGKVLADDELKASLTKAAKAGKIEEWVAAHGVEATEGELLTYVRAIATKSGELTDEQLDIS